MLKLKLQYFGHLKNWLIEKDPNARKDWRQEEKGTTEDEIVGWHHRLDGHEFEQALWDDEGQGSLACCSPWGCKESDAIDWLNNDSMVSTEKKSEFWYSQICCFLSYWLCFCPDVRKILLHFLLTSYFYLSSLWTLSWKNHKETVNLESNFKKWIFARFYKNWDFGNSLVFFCSMP